MKEYNITIDGRPYKVELVKHEVGEPFLVKVNDKSLEVELLSEMTTTTPMSIKMHEKVYRVELSKAQKSEPFPLSVNSTPFKVELRKSPRKATYSSMPFVSPKIAKKPQRKIVEEGAVLAPMAGKIVSVKVSQGDSVKVGTVVCVLEAMKMENEITATKTGSIQEVMVSEGTAVNEGDILLVIE